jgi:hypothetical protein
MGEFFWNWKALEIRTQCGHENPRLGMPLPRLCKLSLFNALPERWVTPDSGHMGNTFRPLRGSAKCRPADTEEARAVRNSEYSSYYAKSGI